MIAELTKESTKILQLSGTPFNLMDDATEEEMFTWDYTMEQRAKQEWDQNHFGDPNPYAGLPRMNIYTYDLGRLLRDFADEDIAFNFKESSELMTTENFCIMPMYSVFSIFLPKKTQKVCTHLPMSNTVASSAIPYGWCRA